MTWLRDPDWTDLWDVVAVALFMLALVIWADYAGDFVRWLDCNDRSTTQEFTAGQWSIREAVRALSGFYRFSWTS